MVELINQKKFLLGKGKGKMREIKFFIVFIKANGLPATG